MEKITFKSANERKLVGVLHLPKEKTKSIIILTHGFTSNKDRPRFIKTAEAFVREGFAFLRYDLGGSGESDEAPVTVENQVKDVKAAIKYVRNRGYKKIGLIGASLGGSASVKAYDEGIGPIVLWSSVIAPKNSLKYGNKKELEEKGFTLFRREGRVYTLPKQYFNERKNFNQKAVLSKIKSPVLMIYGSEDSTIPIKDYKNALEFLSKSSKLKIIKGSGHNLEENLKELIELTLNWFKKYF